MGTRVLGFVLALCWLTPACSRHVDNNIHIAGIRHVVAGTPAWVDRGAAGRRLWTIERAFYAQRGYRPAWVAGDRTTPQMKDLVQQLRYSESHGLDPARYAVDAFEEFRQGSQTRMGTRFELARVPEFDARLTYAYLRYAADLIGWTTSPSQVSRNWLMQPKKEDLAARLSAAIDGNHIGRSLEDLAPTHLQYQGLQAALARERQHPTGEAERIRMNLQRWRWMPRDLGDRYILINVPAFMMQIVEGHAPALAMRVIVGQPDWQTPLFSDEMTYVVFSPYWNIPENILREETLPRALTDPSFLERNNIEVVGTSGVVDHREIDWSDTSETSGLRFRQRPGLDNALGLVKFIFPNHFNVYLHDTPSDRLFGRDRRALSHGCIRVERPADLAQYVLRDQPQWTRPRIVSAMHSHQEQTVKLARPLPVHIGYWTAWVNPDGGVKFFDDPYGLDLAQARLLH